MNWIPVPCWFAQLGGWKREIGGTLVGNRMLPPFRCFLGRACGRTGKPKPPPAPWHGSGGSGWDRQKGHITFMRSMTEADCGPLPLFDVWSHQIADDGMASSPVSTWATWPLCWEESLFELEFEKFWRWQGPASVVPHPRFHGLIFTYRLSDTT